MLGKYGENCSNGCSGHCKGVNRFACNHIDGSCSDGCADGWTGPNCNEGNELADVKLQIYLYFYRVQNSDLIYNQNIYILKINDLLSRLN